MTGIVQSAKNAKKKKNRRHNPVWQGVTVK